MARETGGWRGALATCLVRWHLCSLDAPTVAVAWAAILARLVKVPLWASEGLVLALGTWIVYVLDRVLDGVHPCAGGCHADPGAAWRVRHAPGHAPGHLQERHYFHARHRSRLLWLCCAAGALLALLCCWLPRRLVLLYLALALPVGAYSVWVHAPRKSPGRPSPGGRGNGLAKEAAVAILFTAAVAVPALAGAAGSDRRALWIPLLLLAGLCWLNCTLISHAEASVGGNSRSRPWERLRLKGLALALLLAASWLCGLDPGRRGQASLSAEPAAAAMLLSCVALLGLLMRLGGQDQSPVEARRLRVLADLALLTPLLFLLPRWA